MRVRRVVTGHSSDGKAIVASDEEVEPITLDLLRPRKKGIVIDTRVADLGKAPVQPLHPGHDPKYNARDAARSFNRIDPVGVKDLCWVGRHVSSPGRQVSAVTAPVILSSPAAMAEKRIGANP